MTRLHRKQASRRKRTIESLDFGERMSLILGPGSFDHCGNLTAEDLLELYTENRDLFSVLREPTGKRQPADKYGHRPGRRAWYWWQVDSPEPRNRKIPEVEQLDRLGLLTDEELHMLERDTKWPPPNEQHARLFDRPWGWWRFKSPDLRDWSITEPTQLVTMGRKYLTDRECKILDTGIDPANQRFDSEDLKEIFTTDEIKRFNIPAGT